ncbi:MAG: hypothetical protein ACREQ5_27545, partial [Candidatus Dormibacteria bacterium]
HIAHAVVLFDILQHEIDVRIDVSASLFVDESKNELPSRPLILVDIPKDNCIPPGIKSRIGMMAVGCKVEKGRYEVPSFPLSHPHNDESIVGGDQVPRVNVKCSVAELH